MDVGVSKIGDIKGNVAAMLCYVLSLFFGFIPGIVFLIVDQDNKFIKFHAIQSIALGVIFAVLVCTVVVPIVCLVFLIIAAIHSNKGEVYRIPLIGDLCAKWAGIDIQPGQPV